MDLGGNTPSHTEVVVGTSGRSSRLPSANVYSTFNPKKYIENADGKEVFSSLEEEDELVPIDHEYNYLKLQDEDGKTALHIAAREKSVRCVNIILERLKEMDEKENLQTYGKEVSFLTTKIRPYKASRVANLIDQIDFNQQHSLHLAIDSGSHETVSLILKYHPMPKVILNDDNDATPEIHLAARKDLGMVKLLINYGADIMAVKVRRNEKWR